MWGGGLHPTGCLGVGGGGRLFRARFPRAPCDVPGRVPATWPPSSRRACDVRVCWRPCRLLLPACCSPGFYRHSSRRPGSTCILPAGIVSPAAPLGSTGIVPVAVVTSRYVIVIHLLLFRVLFHELSLAIRAGILVAGWPSTNSGAWGSGGRATFTCPFSPRPL